MSSNAQRNYGLSLQDYHCPACNHLLKDPVQLKCIHRYCRSCLDATRTEMIECRICRVFSFCSQGFADEEFKQKVETSTINCQLCQTFECSNIRQVFPQVSNQSETSLTAENIPTNLIECPFSSAGCVKPFPADKTQDHYISDQHVKILTCIIDKFHLNYHYKLDDSKMNPSGFDQSSKENDSLKIYPIFSETLTDLVSAAIPSMNPESLVVANSNFQLHSECIDRGPNVFSHSQSHAILNQQSKKRMDDLSTVISSQSASMDIQTRLSVQSISQTSNTCPMNVDLDVLTNPVWSWDGILIWHITDITEKIRNAVAYPKSHVDSPSFLTPNHQQRVWVRVHLNGLLTGSKFIAMHIHLNSPQRGPFYGDVKFTLLDQSRNSPFHHIIQQCFGSMINVGDNMGFENFTDKNHLQCASSRYVADDSICIIVQLRSEDTNDFCNIPTNIRDVLMAK